MEEVIEAMEESCREVARGDGKNLPRSRIRTNPTAEGLTYFFNCIPGMLPSRGVMAIRIDSAVRQFSQDRANLRYVNDRYSGWVVLFSIRTGEPLALLHDFSLSGIRVGATTAIAVKYMARKDAKRIGLYGSGKQARTNLEAISKVRPLEEVRVFSPNPDHRRLFAEEMTQVIGAEIVPVDRAEKAMEGADIVLCASNTMTPVFQGDWLKPGTHVASLTFPDKTHTEITGISRNEVDETTMERSALIVINSWEQTVWDNQTELSGWAKEHPGKLAELGDLLTGKVPGRRNEDDINLYASNTGTGNQFAATGAMVYEKARASGVGREIPTEWLMVDLSKWTERGFFPSP